MLYRIQTSMEYDKLAFANYFLWLPAALFDFAGERPGLRQPFLDVGGAALALEQAPVILHADQRGLGLAAGGKGNPLRLSPAGYGPAGLLAGRVRLVWGKCLGEKS